MKEGTHMYQEKIIVGEGTPYPLNGLLTFPDGMTGPVPAAVFVQGIWPAGWPGTASRLCATTSAPLYTRGA